MEYSTLQPWQEIGETGIVHDRGSLYARFHHLTDSRGAKGKWYSLVMLLAVIFLAKLTGKDKPDEIADWAKNHPQELAGLLGLRRTWMPSHSTIRRVFQDILAEAEFTAWRRRTINKNKVEKVKSWPWMAKRCEARASSGKKSLIMF